MARALCIYSIIRFHKVAECMVSWVADKRQYQLHNARIFSAKYRVYAKFHEIIRFAIYYATVLGKSLYFFTRVASELISPVHTLHVFVVVDGGSWAWDLLPGFIFLPTVYCPHRSWLSICWHCHNHLVVKPSTSNNFALLHYHGVTPV